MAGLGALLAASAARNLLSSRDPGNGARAFCAPRGTRSLPCLFAHPHFDNGLDMRTGILGCDGRGNQAGGGTFPSGNCTFPAPPNPLLS